MWTLVQTSLTNSKSAGNVNSAQFPALNNIHTPHPTLSEPKGLRKPLQGAIGQNQLIGSLLEALESQISAYDTGDHELWECFFTLLGWPFQDIFLSLRTPRAKKGKLKS